MQIVDHLIDGLQSGWRAVALTEIGVIITAYAREARNFCLNRVPVFGGAPAGGNEDNGGKARQLTIAIYGDAPLTNADHTLFRKGRQYSGQMKENGQYSRSVEAHIKYFDSAFRELFSFVCGLCTPFRQHELSLPDLAKWSRGEHVSSPSMADSARLTGNPSVIE